MRSRHPLHGLPAEVKARLRERAQPRWVAPMLATLTDERFSREGWLFEPKWDGERCLAFRSGGELNLFTRNRIRLNEKYPELTAAFHRQRTESFIADGEIVTFKDGITSFTKLQERMQVEHPSADLLRRVPVSLYLFDLLYLDRYDTRPVPEASASQRLRLPGFVAAHGALRDAGRCLFPKGMSQRMGGRDREERGQRVRLQENARLAQIQVQPRAGVCRRWLHATAREPDRLRSIATGLLPGPKARVRRQGRDRIRR